LGIEKQVTEKRKRREESKISSSIFFLFVVHFPSLPKQQQK
jgi:hypothetical protein